MGETPCCLTVQGVVLRVLATVIQTTSTPCVFITSTENRTSLYSRKHKYKPQLPHYRRPRNFETHPLVPADNCKYKLIHKPNHKKNYLPLWEKSLFSASNTCSRSFHLCGNSKAHYWFHNSHTPDPIPIQITAIRACISSFLKIQFNIILPLFLKWPRIFRPNLFVNNTNKK